MEALLQQLNTALMEVEASLYNLERERIGLRNQIAVLQKLKPLPQPTPNPTPLPDKKVEKGGEK